MIWLLAVSIVLNLILFVAWLKTLEESREWKACARIGFEVAVTPIEPIRGTTTVIDFSKARRRKDLSKLN